MPTTRAGGRPLTFCITQTMASSGLVMTITKASGQCCADIGRDRLDDAGIGRDQVVPAHAGLARNAGGDDHHIRALERGGVIVGAGDQGVGAKDRRRLDQIQRLAGGQAFDDVEQHDIAKLPLGGQQGEGAADLAGTDEGELAARHDNPAPEGGPTSRSNPAPPF